MSNHGRHGRFYLRFFDFDLRLIVGAKPMWRRRTPLATAARLTSFGGYSSSHAVRQRVHPHATTRASSLHQLRTTNYHLSTAHYLKAERIPLLPCCVFRGFNAKVAKCTQGAQRFLKIASKIQISKNLCGLCEVFALFALKFFHTVQRATTGRTPLATAARLTPFGGYFATSAPHYHLPTINCPLSQSGKDSASPLLSVPTTNYPLPSAHYQS